MANVIVDWTTQDEPITNAATFTTYDITIFAADGTTVVTTATESLGTETHTFLNVAAGNYVASVVLVDGSGNQAAAAVTTSFTVPTAPTAPVPVSVSVSLG